MNLPDDLGYIAEHQWVRAGSPSTVGITDFAQQQLGDIVAVSLPRVGSQVRAGVICGDVESAKTVSDISSPLTGTVIAHNEAALADPTLINDDPYGAGWLFTVDGTTGPATLTAQQYAATIAE